jgi:hypothetical protein
LGRQDNFTPTSAKPSANTLRRRTIAAQSHPDPSVCFSNPGRKNMAIEFRCTKCNKLLRTADDTAGKHAKCPECGEILVIPTAGAPISTPMPAAGAGAGGFPPPPSGPTGGTPFGAGAQPQYQPDSGNPYQSPSPYASLPTMPAGAGEIRPTIIDLGDVMGRAWTIFKEQWAMCLGALVVVGICNYVFSYVTGKLMGSFFQPTVDFRNVNPQQMLSVMIQEYPKHMFGSTLKGYVDLLFYAWTSAGLYIFLLKIARGQPANIGDVFSGGKYYVPMLVTMLIFNLMTQIGFLLLIIPGVIVLLMFGQFNYLIVDRNLGIADSLQKSMEITKGNKLTMLLIWLVCAGLVIVGALPCFLGWLVVFPYMALLHAVIYLTMTGQPTVDQLRAGMGMQ